MKLFADRKRTDREFHPGDFVYLRLQPYRQTSLAIRRSLKLAPRFYGPYKVLERIGSVAYRLELPEDSKIHPIFHVSQLKPKVGSKVVPLINLPEIACTGELQPVPEQILAKKIVRHGRRNITEVLVQWSGSSTNEATWERLLDLKREFPYLNLGDKVPLTGRV
ncbi:hypothetical protein Patl1_22866 [Pistacia atlantica]|uniref:Uncharacterized protein n=1 Tax=Pistacia atlantica TaxID=434234 RepID=A0ACC0ZXW4_9ROSI|nr:hypothetical protein Patl1_22866 [Pistacia atlantica]